MPCESIYVIITGREITKDWIVGSLTSQVALKRTTLMSRAASALVDC